VDPPGEVGPTGSGGKARGVLDAGSEGQRRSYGGGNGLSAGRRAGEAKDVRTAPATTGRATRGSGDEPPDTIGIGNRFRDVGHGAAQEGAEVRAEIVPTALLEGEDQFAWSALVVGEGVGGTTTHPHANGRPELRETGRTTSTGATTARATGRENEVEEFGQHQATMTVGTDNSGRMASAGSTCTPIGRPPTRPAADLPTHNETSDLPATHNGTSDQPATIFGTGTCLLTCYGTLRAARNRGRFYLGILALKLGIGQAFKHCLLARSRPK